jgi:hypothetical protein
MPRPIKWGGKIEGQLIRASTLFRSRTSVVLPQCPSGDKQVVELKILKLSYLKKSKILEMAHVELPPGLSYLKFPSS